MKVQTQTLTGLNRVFWQYQPTSVVNGSYRKEEGPRTRSHRNGAAYKPKHQHSPGWKR